MTVQETQSKKELEDFTDNSLREDPEDEGIKQKRTYWETCRYVLKNITVEPTMFLFIMPIIICGQTFQNLCLEKACRVNLNFSEEICDALKLQTVEEQNPYEKEVQTLVAQALAWKSYITATVPCFLALFIGSFSDITGHRKVFIILPLTGQLLVCINGILNSYFLLETSLEVYVLTDAVIDGISGSWCVCILTIFAYLSYITTEKNRTFRIGLVNLSLTTGFPVGMAVAGILLKNIGYYGAYGVTGGLFLVNLLYNTFILKDPVRTEEQKRHDGKGFIHNCRIFFKLQHIKETIHVVFKKGPNNRRLRIIVMLIVVAILFGPMHGELSIMYMSTRYRFNWDEVQFSIFQTYNFIANTIGTLFSISVFSKYLQWHDSGLGIVSTLSKIAAAFIYCFAANGKIFFIGPVADILNGTALLAMRSLVSKSVSPNELGKVTSIFALVENLTPLAYVPMYTSVYTATMEVLPGAVFLLGAVMSLPALVFFIWLLWGHRRGLRKAEQINGVNQ